MSPNCAELITATLAAQLAGIAAPLNGGLSRAHLAELLRRSGARVLVTAGPELAPDMWDSARELAPELDVILVLRPTGAGTAPTPLPEIPGVRTEYLGHLAASRDPAGFAGSPPKGSDLAALFHTGGTTGAPKLAAHTHANELADAWMLAANSLFDADSAVFAALPLFHVNALIVTTLAPLYKGQQVVWAGPLGYREPALFGQFWRIVEHYRIAAMSAVPTVYATLAQVPVDAHIGSLRVAMVGASPLPAAVRDAFQAHTGVRPARGVWPDRGHLCQRPQLPRRAPARLGRDSACRTSACASSTSSQTGSGRTPHREQSACWRSAARPCSPATSPAATKTATSWTA
jgi:fatty-acyl-CoA synthase